MVNVIGLGYIGLPTALMLASHGVEVVGTDYNKELVDTLNAGKTTFETMCKEFIEKNQVEIAVLTVPKEKAHEVSRMLLDTGIKGVWNFAHTDLNLPEHIMVENVRNSQKVTSIPFFFKSTSF